MCRIKSGNTLFDLTSPRKTSFGVALDAVLVTGSVNLTLQTIVNIDKLKYDNTPARALEAVLECEE
ncbi:MAG: hypothetical protein AVDCRST_MAG14-215 [uncultured Rubrobacteraceae bacterium]|uniref:Uncharacterized protein n=1 Tax=uncultured Rubrobacteraceae bacterium TaxID=349277 RepID=A0A6J4QH03_9ACTN|nr:MAG: hypothetical protein AVDCRST_MAG14-215 [uncultured Rubrobacteraceae bacterium]